MILVKPVFHLRLFARSYGIIKIFKCAKVDGRIVNANIGAPPKINFIPIDTYYARHITRRYSGVARVVRLGCLAQIINPIVRPNAVNVVYLIRRPIAVVHSPRKPVRLVTLT